MSGTDGPDQHDTQCTAATVLFLRRANSGLIRFFLAGGLRQAGPLTIASHLPADLVEYPHLSLASLLAFLLLS